MIPAHPSSAEDEYWRMFQSVRGDVNVTIASNNAYLTIHRLATEDYSIRDKYQRAPRFWNLNTYALQTSLFISFGRIFDKRSNSFSIQKLADATIANPAFFSKVALRHRKRQFSQVLGADPHWLVDFINQAWEPTAADLEPLRTALTPHCDKFKAIYQPLRHKYFAHRGTESQQAIEGLFDKTLKTDVDAILRFLHTLLWAIREMADNGKRPDLVNFADYYREVRTVVGDIERFIRELL